jgi:hypothetical protein
MSAREYLNAHPDMLTKDAIIVMSAALTDAFPVRRRRSNDPGDLTRKLKKLGFTPQKAHELLGIGRSSAFKSSMRRARARSRRAIQVACRRLPLTFLPTTSRIIVRVSLAASSGGRAVSATLLTNLVMS